MLIEGNNLSVAIDGREIVADESVRCAPGEMTALVGPSGSGKTTLLHALGLLLPVSRGHILVDGKDVTSYDGGQRRRFWRDHAAFVLQDYGIVDDESVGFNVTMRGQRRATNADARLSAALEQTGLAGRAGETASHLSGGEKQRLALARAIYRRASVLFVDEPTASLDARNRHTVIELFTGFARQGATVVVSTHDEEMIAACDSRHPMGMREVQTVTTATGRR
ncbi:ATP-binding cassette domain-containing protein [Brachybacterium sp. EF45031]|uniref:ABC transporter ATP-binding protein n=1 Tax=Brachybacterium sillae TaxID=2810536 RepID=UPI00217EDACE|nr:ATP-binding cassette domain-containing protein [Brachybacterium sillae]MCS6711598.1 ATP-binding cassette domain-containing protein [Brachybacterium sillae]